MSSIILFNYLKLYCCLVNDIYIQSNKKVINM